MELSSHHFAEPTLILRFDRMHAEFWMADQETCEMLETLSREKPTYTDNEASNANAGTSDADDTAEVRQYVKRIADGLALLQSEGDLAHVWLAAEAELLHLLQEDANQAVKACFDKMISVNVMKDSVPELLERFALK